MLESELDDEKEINFSKIISNLKKLNGKKVVFFYLGTWRFYSKFYRLYRESRTR